MKVPYDPIPTVGISKTAMQYLQPAVPDYSGLVQGLKAMASLAERKNADEEALRRYKAVEAFNAFKTDVGNTSLDLKRASQPGDTTLEDKLNKNYQDYENKFIASLDPEFQEEFRARASEVKLGTALDAHQTGITQRERYFADGLDKGSNRGAERVRSDPKSLDDQARAMDELIDASAYDENTKAELKQKNRAYFEKIAYGVEVKQEKLNAKTYQNELAQSIVSAARELGTTPEDLATVIAYETIGKFSTSIYGGKGGKYLGLIQFGPEEQKKYGVVAGQPPAQQMQAVVAFLKDRGFKPGMSILDLYSTINAGQPGRYNASDRPGMTIASHVAGMDRAREQGLAFLGGTYEIDLPQRTDPRFASLTFEEKTVLETGADTTATAEFNSIQQAQKSQYNSFLNDVLMKAADGTFGQPELDDLLKTGRITDYEDRKKVQTIIDARGKEVDLLANAQAKLESGDLWIGTDEDDKKMANAVYKATNGRVGLSKLDGKFVNDVLLPFANKTKMLPPDAVGDLTALSRSSDPRQQMFALEALSKLRSTEPFSFNAQVTDDVKKMVDLLEVGRGALSPEQLQDALMGGRTAEARNARKVLEVEFDEVMRTPSNENHRSFDSVLSSFDPGMFSSEPSSTASFAAKTAMEGEWKLLVKEALITTQGNWDAAYKLADRAILRNWGVVDFDGSRTLMKYPPAAMGYKQFNGSYEWMAKQLRKELNVADDVRLQIISDERTKAEFVKKQNAPPDGVGPWGRSLTSNPSYQVMQFKDGFWQPVFDDKNRPVRWYGQITTGMKIEEEEKVRLTQYRAEYEKFMRDTNSQRKIVAGGRGGVMYEPLTDVQQREKERLESRIVRQESVAGDNETIAQRALSTELSRKRILLEQLSDDELKKYWDRKDKYLPEERQLLEEVVRDRYGGEQVLGAPFAKKQEETPEPEDKKPPAIQPQKQFDKPLSPKVMKNLPTGDFILYARGLKDFPKNTQDAIVRELIHRKIFTKKDIEDFRKTFDFDNDADAVLELFRSGG
jgi:hypothetical protein